MVCFSTETDCNGRLIHWRHYNDNVPRDYAIRNPGDNERGSKMKRQLRFVKIHGEEKIMLGTHGGTWVGSGKGGFVRKRSGMPVVSLRSIN